MNIKTLTAVALLSAGSLLAAGCQTDSHSRTAGSVVDDSTITTRVKTALLAEKDINSFDIKVKTYNGTVQLSGFVDSQWQINKAVEVASAVDGVQDVTNDLIHKSKK